MGFTEAVAVLRPVSTGETTAHGEPVVEWVPETVEGCTVRPMEGTQSGSSDARAGQTSRLEIAFPKAYTADLRECRVALVDRGMDADDADSAFRVSAGREPTKGAPTVWDRIVEVWRADG